MSETKVEGASGTWRQGEFVRWQDLLVLVQALLVWSGLFTLTFTVALALNDRLGISRADISRMASSVSSSTDGTQIAAATFELVLLFYAWRVSRRVADTSLVARYRSIGRGAFALAFAGGISLALLSIVTNSQLASHSLVEFHTTKAERILMPQSPENLPLSLLCIALIAPLAEELYFRGIVLSWFRRKVAAPLAALMSAAAFALLHFRFASHTGMDGWVHTGTIAVLGLVTATLAMRTRSLWGPFAVHAGYNATLVAVVALGPLLLR